MHKIKSIRGFSLIEIVVGIALFGLLGAIASQSLFSLLRGANQTELVKEIKQNGDYALSVMSVKIRNSTISNCTSGSSLTIINPDGTSTVFSCAVNESVNKISQDGTDFLTNSLVTLPTCSSLSFVCTDNNGVRNILISFTLEQANASANAAESGSEFFQTQITLRNK